MLNTSLLAHAATGNDDTHASAAIPPGKLVRLVVILLSMCGVDGPPLARPVLGRSVTNDANHNQTFPALRRRQDPARLGRSRHTEAAPKPDRRRSPLRQRYDRLASAMPSASRVPITSCICPVSRYCWKLVALPLVSFHTWQTCASTLLPVDL